jgi:hypothetical protein
MKRVRLHLHAAAADIAAQNDETPGGFEGDGELLGIGRVETLIASEPHQFDGAVGEHPADLAPLGLAEHRLDAVPVGGAQLHTVNAGLFEHRQQLRQLQVVAPVVGDQAEADRAALAGPSGRGQGCGGGRGLHHLPTRERGVLHAAAP